MRHPRRLLLLLAIAASGPTSAQQLVQVDDGETAIVQISSREMSRLRMAVGRIDMLRHTEGELIVQEDKERGELYLRPTIGKPVNVFITSDSGNTFALLLTPKDVPSETVLLRERIRPSGGGHQAGSFRDANPQKRIEKLILAMARSDLPADADVRERGQRLPLWKNTHFTLERTYFGDTYIGEVYALSNLGDKPLVMVEQEFYRDGVVAVAIDHMTLRKNERTNLYIVRRRLANE